MKRWVWLAIAGVVILWASGGATSTVQRIANAIAYAEGFNVPNSRAARNRNPGNLTASFGFPVEWDGMFAIFQTLEDGWTALRMQVQMMRDGSSTYYDPTMSIEQIAQVYTATDPSAWASNVAAQLGVSVTTPIGAI